MGCALFVGCARPVTICSATNTPKPRSLRWCNHIELGDAHEWSEFERAGPELFADHRALLLRLYTAERLDSELARRSFLLPDRVASAHGREARG